MLTRWLTFTVFLAGSAKPERAAITVAPTCRVKVHPEGELTLKCGDGKSAGAVQYWHTPFGELQIPGFHSNMDPVFMHHDGSLLVPNTSILHSGLYYCLLQHTESTTLWPYQLHVSHDNQKTREDSKYGQHSSCDAFRFRRDVGSEAVRQEGVSDGQFAGAVAASVLLTFVVGFSAGALTRTHVLRCLGGVTTRVRSLRNQRYQADIGSEVTMTTLPPMHDNHAFEVEQEDDGSTNYVSRDTTISSITSSPPAKPKRSFRHRRQEEEQEQEQETTAYLEGCDNVKEEERRMEEEEERGLARSLEEMNKGSEGETEEEAERGFYLLGEDEGSQTETGEDECSEGEEKDRRESRKEKKERRQEKEAEERDEQENRSKEGEERRGSEEETRSNNEKEVEEGDEQENRSKEGGEERRGSEEAGGKKEKGRDEKREEEGGWREEKEGDDGEKKRREEARETETCSEDSEAGSNEQNIMKSGIIEGEEAVSSQSCPAPRKRIIRLYQYDDDGQRYGHLPDPAPNEPVPAPRLKQRSLSLTRLSAIMAAATAGPLETTETGKEEKPQFHMEI